jgi:HAMP domain-containing protein
MRSLSINFKVLLALTAGVCAAAVVLTALAERSYRENMRSVSNHALATAQRTFQNVEASETSKLGATLTALMGDDRMRELYLRRDRAALYDYAKPTYDMLNATYAITNWHFMDVEPEMFIFLRLHDPANHSEVFWHQTAVNAIQSRSMASGMELGKFGFALRVVSPYDDRKGNVIGYMEVAEDIGRFASTMKAQSGDDYALVATKALLDRKSYETSVARRHDRDAWDDLPDGLVLGATTSGATLERLARSDGSDIAGIPTTGRFLEQIRDGGGVWVRGVFPLVDVSKKTIGAVFVEHDITSLHRELEAARNRTLATIGVLLVGLAGAMAFALRRLVFSRIDRTMLVATRVVGGDFETPIRTELDDEVGRLEMLLEGFRQVFVTSVREYEQRIAALTADPAAGSKDSSSEPARPAAAPPPLEALQGVPRG